MMIMHNDKELAACVLLATNAAWDVLCACGGLMRPTRAFAAGLLSWAFLVALCVLIFV